MPELWPVFLTAAKATPKALNKAFLLLKDFEFTDPLTDSLWTLLTSSDLSKISPKPTIPPLEPVNENDFANKTLADINNFVRTNEAKLQKLNILTIVWVIIDQEGLDNGTCIVVDQDYDEDAKAMASTSKALRLPFHVAFSLVGNLEIANMGFEEWADQDAGVQADGLYKWVGPFPGENDGITEQERKTEPMREAALKALKDLGHVD